MRIFKWIGIVLTIGVFGVGVGLGLGLTSNLPGGGPLGWLGKSAGAPALAQQNRRTAPAVPNQAGSRRSVRHTIVVDVAQQVSPAVVSIGVTKKTIARQYYDLGSDLFFSPYILGPQRQSFPYLGSGFIIDKQGHVLTNYHVVEDSDEIFVTLTDRRTYPAQLLDADRFVDVALLKIENLKSGDNLPVIPLGRSDDIMIGETVLAIGNPFGPLIADPRPSVSQGVVSAVQRSFKAEMDGRVYQDMIQTDAAINPGNSGGPLVNLDGEVIGINTFIFSRSGDSSSVGFSIPINRAARIADEIIRHGKVRSLRKDFEVIKLTPFYKQALGITLDRGALVHAVDAKGPAQRAGLRPGDVIIRADDKEIGDDADLISYFLTRTVGETVRLRVVREGREVDINYQITEGSSS